jgi:predicted acetyltransferase
MVPSGQGTDFAMAEFYIIPEARQDGLGQIAASAAFAQHTGQWELGVVNANTGGYEFWNRVLAKYTATQITNGPETIFRFQT